MIGLSLSRGTAASILVAASILFSSAELKADASFTTPNSWPQSEQLTPAITAWPNAIRLWGPDRYQTSLAVALTLRGTGEYPFNSPDPSGGNSDAVLSESSHWWGLGACPRSIILTAGDSPADALAASSLSDPVGMTRGPWLRRAASADPLFDPIGGYQNVNTHLAPVLITRSKRSGGSSLSLATQVAVKDLRSGGCKLARDAIIVGGPVAVPVEVEDELLSLGIRQVFRVGGKNRYETAAAVARALGTEGFRVGEIRCHDEYSSDGGVDSRFYAGSVVEWRASSSQCELLERTVVLADGRTGADALAAAWWTGFWQVPVLLHDGTQKLPDATAAALQSMDVSNLLVLGGPLRISDSVVVEAVSYSRASTRRVAGVDRYATSTLMAKYFGGWWGTGAATERQSSMLCFAASSGGRSDLTGWPDALGAGAWCAAAAAAGGRAPARATYPHNGPYSRILTSPGKRPQAMVPVILVPANARTLPQPTKDFLAGAYPSSATWCSSNKSSAACFQPGFGVVFGGTSTFPDELVAELSALLGGVQDESHRRSRPQLIRPFLTGLEMTPIHFQTGSGDLRFCLPRGGYEGARWLVVRNEGSRGLKVFNDVVRDGWYKSDLGGLQQLSSDGSPGCIRFADDHGTKLEVGLVGPEGWSSLWKDFSVSQGARVRLSEPIITSGPVSVAGPSLAVVDANGGLSEAVFWTSAPNINLQSGATESTVRTTELKFDLLRGQERGRATFRAEWTLISSDERLTGTATGEARLVNGRWMARGRAEAIGEHRFSGAVGGFAADFPAQMASLVSFSGKWQLDLFLS